MKVKERPAKARVNMISGEIRFSAFDRSIQSYLYKTSMLLVCLFLLFFASEAQNKTRIACIGGGVTYGTGVANRERNNYPKQLQHMLGNDYLVENFGASGAIPLRKGSDSYWASAVYKVAVASRPDIVFIDLGSHDRKAFDRSFYNEFESDYKALLKSFQDLPSKARIVLLLPVPDFSSDTNFKYDQVITKQIIPIIQQAAYESGVEVVDLYHLFAGNADLFPDKIHPSAIGATVIAKRLYEVVKSKPATGKSIFTKIKEEKQITSFYGFRCAEFIFNNRNCKVVEPKVSAKGNPWIWRARFWGHEPQADIALLERGFHLVYCDVAELFGNSQAIQIWNSFYSYMRRCGLSEKPALEGMSRGGIYVYNWALANPGKVSCIYADAPVLDLKSWPGGKGKSPGSKENWEIVKKDFNLNDEAANHYENNPLDNASTIAGLGFPMLHVVGDADEVVPVDENSNPFEAKIKAAGGSITVIHKPGVKHHPHSLQNPTPIVHFILHATGQKVNFATIAAPGSEYRSGAGWLEGKDWWAQSENIDSLLTTESGLDIVFVGNSITQGIGGHRTLISYKPGLAVFDSVFSGYKWECAGISGDRTQNVLWRLQNGQYKVAKPKVMVITIGVNNFIDDDTPEEIAAGIMAIADYSVKNMPSTKIIVTGPLPTGLEKGSERRKKYENIHRLLASRKGIKYTYLPMTVPLLKVDGSLDTKEFSKDGIHLQNDGYRKWAVALQPSITRFVKNKK
jgi:lysophospholipase L1-like esterase